MQLTELSRIPNQPAFITAFFDGVYAVDGDVASFCFSDTTLSLKLMSELIFSFLGCLNRAILLDCVLSSSLPSLGGGFMLERASAWAKSGNSPGGQISSRGL